MSEEIGNKYRSETARMAENETMYDLDCRVGLALT
jgi:hypothetical protein